MDAHVRGVLDDAEIAKLDSALALIKASGALGQLRVRLAKLTFQVVESNPPLDPQAVASACRIIQIPGERLKARFRAIGPLAYQSSGVLVQQAIRETAHELRHGGHQ